MFTQGSSIMNVCAMHNVQYIVYRNYRESYWYDNCGCFILYIIICSILLISILLLPRWLRYIKISLQLRHRWSAVWVSAVKFPWSTLPLERFKPVVPYPTNNLQPQRETCPSMLPHHIHLCFFRVTTYSHPVACLSVLNHNSYTIGVWKSPGTWRTILNVLPESKVHVLNGIS